MFAHFRNRAQQVSVVMSQIRADTPDLAWFSAGAGPVLSHTRRGQALLARSAVLIPACQERYSHRPRISSAWFRLWQSRTSSPRSPGWPRRGQTLLVLPTRPICCIMRRFACISCPVMLASEHFVRVKHPQLVVPVSFKALYVHWQIRSGESAAQPVADAFQGVLRAKRLMVPRFNRQTRVKGARER